MVAFSNWSFELRLPLGQKFVLEGNELRVYSFLWGVL